MRGNIEISLWGCFRVTAPDQTDMTPRSAKACALLALLATSRGMLRNRKWLQSMLWSDRQPVQGAGSLRQALTEIRRCFGPFSDLLITNRRDVGLDVTRISLVEPDAPTHVQFLEGLDVRDPEFEDWLRQERLQSDAMPPAQSQNDHTVQSMSVVLVPLPTADPNTQLVRDVFVDSLARSLTETLGLQTEISSVELTGGTRHQVCVQAFPASNDQIGLRVRLLVGHLNAVIWTGIGAVDSALLAPLRDTTLGRLCNETVQQLADFLLTVPSDRLQITDRANALCRQSIRKIFSLDPVEFETADRLLSEAFEISPRGVFLAWKAQLNVMRLVERTGGCPEGLADSVRALSRRAMELDPWNSVVLATLANAHLLLDRNKSAALDFANRSVELNPLNPLALDSKARGLLHAGRLEEAYAYSKRSQLVCSTSPNKFFWDMGLCVNATFLGRNEEALRLAKTASASRPGFTAPLRYKTVLLANSGDIEGARDTAKQISSQEAGFSVNRLVNDPTYPVAPLRERGLLETDEIRALMD